jgi:hypothetical protein
MESVNSTLSIFLLVINHIKIIKMRSIKQALVILVFVCSTLMIQAQDVMMQGFYWDYPTTFGIQTYAKNLQGLIPDMKEAGFTYLWLPPLSRAQM